MADLKLIAMDAQELALISAHVQDAVSKPGMLEFSEKRKQFSLVLNRFAWDAEKGERAKGYERRGSALVFTGVNSVRALGVRRDDPEQVLSLLTIQFTLGEMPGGKIDLIFANGPIVQLEVECVEARLDDLGAVWETKFKPRHPLT